MQSSGILHRVDLVRTDVSKELSAFIRVKRIGGGAKFLRFLQEPYGITSQRTAFFTVTAVKTSNLTQL
jgi:hypothetical protein